VPAGKIYAWDSKSTYVKNPPYFDGITMQPAAVAAIRDARVLALLGDSVTTDHISPAGNIAKGSPARATWSNSTCNRRTSISTARAGANTRS